MRIESILKQIQKLTEKLSKPKELINQILKNLLYILMKSNQKLNLEMKTK